MADQTPPADDENAVDPTEQQTAAEETAAAQVPVPAEDEQPAVGTEEAAPEAVAVPDPAAASAPGDPAPELAADVAPDANVSEDEDLEDDEPETPRVKPAIPGMDLEVDIVLDGEEGKGDEDGDSDGSDEDEDLHAEPIAASIVLAEGARYRATGKRKTAVARVILKPGTGVYLVNGKTLDVFFPRPTLQRNIRQPLEAVGYDDRMDVDVRIHGGGVSSQAGALRHGISRALLEADPNLRGELKKRGFLTRDARVKERKKAGLKKARKKPQFSKR
ncbi:MAG: rpsI [Solirubrobacterales bacterium]|jgi:small subunit ribosomal protein S9|nr:rpsI [Solirubrobacterales bacterium]